MYVGNFGPIPFIVSGYGTRTYRDLERSRTDTWAEHQILDGPALLQRTATGLDQLSFKVRLAASLGTDPATEMQLLRKFMDMAKPWPLFISFWIVGTYVLTEVRESWQRTSPWGRLIVADLNCSFKEYVAWKPK